MSGPSGLFDVIATAAFLISSVFLGAATFTSQILFERHTTQAFLVLTDQVGEHDDRMYTLGHRIAYWCMGVGASLLAVALVALGFLYSVWLGVLVLVAVLFAYVTCGAVTFIVTNKDLDTPGDLDR